MAQNDSSPERAHRIRQAEHHAYLLAAAAAGMSVPTFANVTRTDDGAMVECQVFVPYEAMRTFLACQEQDE